MLLSFAPKTAWSFPHRSSHRRSRQTRLILPCYRARVEKLHMQPAVSRGWGLCRAPLLWPAAGGRKQKVMPGTSYL